MCIRDSILERGVKIARIVAQREGQIFADRLVFKRKIVHYNAGKAVVIPDSQLELINRLDPANICNGYPAVPDVYKRQ